MSRSRIMHCITLLLAAYTSVAFLPTVTLQRRPFHTSVASSTSNEAGTTPVTVTGNNIELTPALETYVTSKIEKVLSKHSSSRLVNEVACTVHLSVSKNPKVADGHTAEVVTLLKGATIRVAESSPDMYSSVDLVADRLSRKLQKYKTRKMSGYHGKCMKSMFDYWHACAMRH